MTTTLDLCVKGGSSQTFIYHLLVATFMPCNRCGVLDDNPFFWKVASYGLKGLPPPCDMSSDHPISSIQCTFHLTFTGRILCKLLVSSYMVADYKFYEMDIYILLHARQSLYMYFCLQVIMIKSTSRSWALNRLKAHF